VSRRLRIINASPPCPSCAAGNVVKRLRAVARPHAVDLDDDEADLGEGLHLVVGGERLWNERAVRAGIDVFDHRIFDARIEVRRTVNHAPDVGLAVAAFRREDFRRLPAGVRKLGDVAPLELGDERTVGSAVEFGHRREIHAGVGVDVVRQVRGKRHDVVGVGLRERRETRAVEVDPIERRSSGRLGAHAASVAPPGQNFKYPTTIRRGRRCPRSGLR
jgi:hypothetical protein